MKLALLILAAGLVLFVVRRVMELAPAQRRKLWRWTLGLGVVALLVGVSFRYGLHWLVVAGAALLAVLRRLLPLAINNDAKMDRVPVGVPWYFVVNAQATAAEQEAGKKFLDFMANSDVGRRYAVEEFGFIPAFKGVPGEGLGGVGQAILAFAEKNKTIPWVFGMWPDGFAQQDAFNNLQAYIAGKQSWAETLQALDESWQDRSK